MTALTFPSNPQQGDIYNAPNNLQYYFDSVKWIVQTTTTTSQDITNFVQDAVAPVFENIISDNIGFSYNETTNVLSATITGTTGNITFTNNNISSSTGDFRLTGGENSTIYIPQAGSGNSLLLYAGKDNAWQFATDGSLRTPHNTIYTDQNSGTALVPNTPTLVFTSANAPWVGGVKLLLIAQGSLTGQSLSDTGNQWHTQMAEAMIANRPWENTSEPVMTVYGVTYTSTGAFVTYSVQKNATTSAIEVYATTAESTYTIRVRANATHVNAF